MCEEQDVIERLLGRDSAWAKERLNAESHCVLLYRSDAYPLLFKNGSASNSNKSQLYTKALNMGRRGRWRLDSWAYSRQQPFDYHYGYYPQRRPSAYRGWDRTWTS